MAIKLENEKKKMRNPHNRTWNKGRNTEKVENEKNTLQEVDNGDKTEKTWKMRHTV